MQITVSELLQGVRHVQRFAPQEWPKASARLLARAAEAQRFVAITGRVHPYYGDGSLGSAALHLGAGGGNGILNGATLQAMKALLDQNQHLRCDDMCD